MALARPRVLQSVRHAPQSPKQALTRPNSNRPPAMAKLAEEIIRQQWPLRHHRDPLLRSQARSLIRTHVVMLRKWRSAAVLAR
jgi:hypothetical protein